MVYPDDKPDYGFSFKNKSELVKWADSFFFGGYKIEEYNNKGIKILIIIGSFTSGLDTSYLRIYLYNDDKLELLILRESVQGKIEVVNKNDTISILNNKKTILIVPWDGLYSTWRTK